MIYQLIQFHSFDCPSSVTSVRSRVPVFPITWLGFCTVCIILLSMACSWLFLLVAQKQSEDLAIRVTCQKCHVITINFLFTELFYKNKITLTIVELYWTPAWLWLPMARAYDRITAVPILNITTLVLERYCLHSEQELNNKKTLYSCVRNTVWKLL